MEATATQTSIQATVFPVLVVTSRSFNVRSRRREGWFAETADKRYSAERTEDDGTPWIVRFGEATLAWTGSLKKAQKIVSNHFLRNVLRPLVDPDRLLELQHLASMEATATQTSIQATVFPVLVVTSRSFNVRSRRREGWFAETADKRYSAERTEDDGTPWIVRFGEATLAWTGSLKKAQKIVSNHFLRNAK